MTRPRYRLVWLLLLALACASFGSGTRWIVPDAGGHGVDVYERPGGKRIDKLVDARVTPLRIEGNHWQVRTAAGRDVWLGEADFPVPVLEDGFAARHKIHVATAFPIAAQGMQPLLAIQVDTQLPGSELGSEVLGEELRSIWSLYRPYAASVERVSITVLGGDVGEGAAIRCGQGELQGYVRSYRRLCARRESGGEAGTTDAPRWGPLGPCAPEDTRGEARRRSLSPGRWPCPEPLSAPRPPVKLRELSLSRSAAERRAGPGGQREAAPCSTRSSRS